MFRRIAILIVLIFSTCICFSQGILPPQEINFVTVNTSTGEVTIDWEPSVSIDVVGYNIYVYSDGYWIYLDKVLHPATTYLHKVTHLTRPCEADSIPESYRVASYDGASPANVSQMCDPHTTIYMTYSFDPCHGRNRLTWTPYLLWNSNVFRYEIYYKEDAGGWSVLGDVPGDQTSFIHSDMTPNVSYQYYIKAIDGSQTKTSSSNSNHKNPLLADMPYPPGDVFNADYCTVTGDNKVELSFTLDPTADINRYKLMRSDVYHVNWDTIALFELADITGNKIKYTDYFDINTNIIYYKLMAVNTCNVDIKSSNIASNIILNVSPDESVINTLSWNNYRNWKGNILEFKLFRVNDNDTFLVATIPYGDTTCIDNLEEYIYYYGNPTPVPNPYLLQPNMNGKFCYYLVAYEGNNPLNMNYTSKSNTVCSDQFTRFFIPNAFNPNSIKGNDKFFPFLTFTNYTDYSFLIYNRWGETMFQTNDPRGYWDGKIDGKPAPQGGYIYLIKYKSSDEEVHEKSGFFVLYY